MEERQQDIEHCGNGSQAGLNVGSEAVANTLQIADHGNHRQGRFDVHAVIPGAFGTQFEIVGHAVGIAKAKVGKDDGFLFKLFGQVQEGLVMGTLLVLVQSPTI